MPSGAHSCTVTDRSVSTLLTLAGRDDEKKKGHDFPEVLMDQIKRLREQLEEEERQYRLNRMSAVEGEGKRSGKSKSAMRGQDENRPPPHHEEYILTTDGYTQVPLSSFADETTLPTESGTMTPSERRSKDAVCFGFTVKVSLDGEMYGPDGEIIEASQLDLDPSIRSQMADAEGQRRPW